MRLENHLDRNAIGHLLAAARVDAWGVAANAPRLPLAPELPRAISILMHLRPAALAGLAFGPSRAYFDEYTRLNEALAHAAHALADELQDHGHQAIVVPPTGSDRNYFPHKTAATSAGLGWIGKTALFVSEAFGPSVRLATVFTDLELTPGSPIQDGRCEDCTACVTACPVGAGKDVTWRAGMSLDELLAVDACRGHLRRYEEFGRICGVCIGACPLSRSN